jgi:predicted alpha/beta superfamily hydrolase
MPQFDRHRTIRILLPPDYATSPNKRYPVVYMQDGQNLFDPATAFGGRDWQIPKTIDKLPKKYQAIIVGVDNGGIDRINEYTPFKRGNEGGQAALYGAFLMETLKPFIDKTYRTLPQREMTGIAGSSLGGLLSLFIGLKNGEIFGKIGVFSPSIWFNPAIMKMVENHKNVKSQFYVLGSKTESRTMEKHLQELYWAFKKGGFSDDTIRVTVRNRGEHNEIFWGREFEQMMRFFFT